MEKTAMQAKEILLVKIGTDQLCKTVDEARMLDASVFSDIARQIAALMTTGVRVLIVSSGATQAGREACPDLLLDDQDLVAVGQPKLMEKFWAPAFSAVGITTAQIVVTHENWVERDERESIRARIMNLMRCDIVPIINENDPVSARELVTMKQGLSENDDLAAKVAKLVGADAAMFLTNCGGVYSADPEEHDDVRRYIEVPCDYESQQLALTASKNQKGRGGMLAKLAAAAVCARSGIRTTIANKSTNAIVRFANGDPVGTLIGTALRLAE